MQLSLNRSGIAPLSKLLNRFGRWWINEFLNLFPERYAEFFTGRGRQRLVISAGQEGVTLELLGGALAPIASERTVSVGDLLLEIDRFLLSRKLERRDVDLGLRLPAESVFGRQLVLPAEAGGAVDDIIAQDLARKTPFKADDIYCDHVASEIAGGEKIEVRQWIIRRQFVHHALAEFNMSLDNIAFIMFDACNSEQPAPMINLRRSVEARNSWRRKLVPALCCSALVLALLSGCLKYLNQQAVLDRLGDEIATTGKKAQHVRALVDQLHEKRNALVRLRLQRSEVPGLIDLWEETTRIMPPHSWLTEFRLTETPGKREEQVTMVGFSGAAPSLVGIVDGSRLFFDAALTSPVAFDAVEGRERFALQAKVRRPAMLKEAAR
jgi:general secretion pathway protein L